MAIKEKQIFHDPTNGRWQYLKWILIFSFFSYTAMLILTVLSIYHHPILPQEGIMKKFSFAENKISSIANFFSNAEFLGVTMVNASPDKEVKIDISQNSCSSLDENSLPPVFAYHADWDENSLTSLKKNIDQIDYLILDWYEIDFENFEFLPNYKNNQEKAIEYIKTHKPELPLIMTINNFDSQNGSRKGDIFTEELKEKDKRTQFIESLEQFVRSNGFSGINIDFGDIPPEDNGDFISFMDELYARFHPLEITVTQTMNLNSLSEDAPEFAEYSDFLIIIAYDEHNTYATDAGPIASQKWFKKRTAGLFSKIPPEKLVITFGNFGYAWKEDHSAGKQLSFAEVMYLAKKTEQKIIFDQDSLNLFFSYQDEKDINNTIWFQDATTFFNQFSSIKCKPVFGIGIGRLGLEDPAVWQIIKKSKQNNFEETQFISKIDISDLIIYQGEGEVLKVAEAPVEGRRNVVFDESRGQITEEQFIKYPLSYVVARFAAKNPKQIVLTFDDGPDEQYTPEILDILKNNDAKATFFLIGSKILKYPGIAKRILQEGSEVGSHTFSHPNITNLSEKHLEIELSAFQRVFDSVSGKHTVLFRPPFGEDVEPEKLEELKSILVTSRLGYLTVAMHIDSGDWKTNDAGLITQRIIDAAEAGKGNVILLHDSGGERSTTVEALPGIITELKNRGFEFVTVSQLIGEENTAFMPDASDSEKNIATVNKANFNFMNGLLVALKMLFVFGIAIGISRSLFITALAIWQWRDKKKKLQSEVSEPFEPFVSILVPAYNERKVVGKTLDSIFRSKYQQLEVIVINDGSTDGTGSYLKSKYKNNPKVKILSQKNSGKASALNLGLLKSKAEFIIALDADTLFEPDTISRLIENFRDPNIGAVAGNTKVGNQINFMTKCQAVEYVTCQNLDRRAFHWLNCISVVPGAIGAWRKKAILAAGGYSHQTLAEDADLTFSIIEQGYRVVYEDEAIAFTEAPDNVRGFLKQRFRWMYGSLQTIWKHRGTALRPKYGALGFVIFPNVLIFQIAFPFISPVLDLYMAVALGWAGWQAMNHPSLEYSGFYGFYGVFIFYILFLFLDLTSSTLALSLEKKGEKKLILWIIAQRFFYRQLMYYIAIKTVFMMIKGSSVGWNKLERKNTVFLDSAIPLQEALEKSC